MCRCRSFVDHNFFLGPANDVRHGRYVLVDTYSQYGVTIIYFIAAALKLLPFGYGSLVLVIGVLTAVGAVVIFAVLYVATRSIVLAALATFVASIAAPSRRPVESRKFRALASCVLASPGCWSLLLS